MLKNTGFVIKGQSLFNIILNFLIKSKSLRTKRIKKNIIFSFIIKGISILLGFGLVPITLKYLDPMQYGIWLTITSILTWFSFFDIGLGNGLRNKFAEAISLADYKKAKIYVSTTYISLSFLILFVYLIFLIVNYFVDWNKIFNVSINTPNIKLKQTVFIIFTFFSIQFILKLITSLLLAVQKSSLKDLIELIGKVFIFALIFLLSRFSRGSLLTFSLIYSGIPVLVLVLFSLYFFSTEFKNFVPSIKDFRYDKVRELINLGINFFIIQIAAVVLFSTDNVIISRLFDPASVIPYNIAKKYFTILMMPFILIITPFWSAITEAYTKKEIDWIKNNIKKLIKLWLILFAIIVLMLIFSESFYKFWIGNKVKIPFLLSLFMAIFVLINSWNSIFSHFLNGIGKIKLQRYLSITVSILNIPLSIFFAKTLHMGIVGIIIATDLCLILSAILSPIQYSLIINNKAKGIWNE